MKFVISALAILATLKVTAHAVEVTPIASMTSSTAWTKAETLTLATDGYVYRTEADGRLAIVAVVPEEVLTESLNRASWIKATAELITTRDAENCASDGMASYRVYNAKGVAKIVLLDSGCSTTELNDTRSRRGAGYLASVLNDAWQVIPRK